MEIINDLIANAIHLWKSVIICLLISMLLGSFLYYNGITTLILYKKDKIELSTFEKFPVIFSLERGMNHGNKSVSW